ncbi:hypothetical protein EBAPG3_002015 [Nitrosospira lacus]|uniref:Uncharacterized protein n=1 Tax=Nitrosospira lacus TaxID=1288494 RepID=A0A1W6SLH9_9PROT|nr:hypothetical protein [Nitrosospira lacus]ARO86650.1 hypothetical protein EBAPG3_002015 [Nitrosospira lacus]
MLSTLIETYTLASKWSNDNQGVVSIAVFAGTIAFGWASGIFSALRRRPKFKLSLIDGPTFCCTYPIGKLHQEFEVHRTGVALYLAIANVGSAASSIEDISVGYHWHLRPFSVNWLKYTVGWFWLTAQSAALADFQANIGNSIKVYPFLTQVNFLSSAKAITYLEVGRSTNGVIYFEQADSWGGCFPKVHDGRVRIRVRVRDVFGKRHAAKFTIASVSLEEARKYNPAFGKTLAELRGEPLPYDKSI